MIPLPQTTDVFVIGGGPAGLAAALAARRRGLDVTLADCGVPPVDKACGEGVMPDGLAAAKSLGLDLESAGGHPFRGIRFCDGDIAVQALFPHGSGRGLRRTLLHAAMVDRAAQSGVRMAWGARVHGISPAGVRIEDRLVRARWIVGADGGHSAVRRWAGLDASRRDTRRFGFRQHFRIAPWSEFMELHWADGCQLYVTPVGADEICVVLISGDQHLRLEDALPRFPAMQHRLRNATAATLERGGVTASRRLERVWAGNVALVGDASGSVDAITGEGLCLLFQQAEALAAAIAAGDLARYQGQHRRIGRRPALMAGLMLLMDQRRRLRRRTIRAMAERPRIFARMLAAHTGALDLGGLVTNGLALGWQMLTL
ncbi:MAG TPA: FAD-dependent monooxygenase [Verrucomicrobiae bacterium]|nr:FAD-dependent monooxygenase [Verrucomicrobiae bacterium]